MLSRMRPVDVEVSFDNRTYHLGDNIDLTIELTPRRDCQVREARVDLIVKETWTDRITQTRERPIRSIAGARGETVTYGTETVTEEKFTNHKETSVHSTIMFMKDQGLTSRKSSSYQPRLQVGEKPPRLAKTSSTQSNVKINWWVQTVIDVQGARDVKPRTKIDVSVAPGKAG